jgi:hypothetical protein
LHFVPSNHQHHRSMLLYSHHSFLTYLFDITD